MAPPGSLCAAYERRESTTGVVRYRTAHGWLSEFRRDQQRDAIVELLSLTPCRRATGTGTGTGTGAGAECPHPGGPEEGRRWAELEGIVAADPARRKVRAPLSPSPPLLTLPRFTALSPAARSLALKVAEALTLRESTSHAMVRVHGNLRSVAAYLARLCHIDERTHARSRPTLSPAASALSVALSKILRSFLTHPMACLQDGEAPPSLALLNQVEPSPAAASSSSSSGTFDSPPPKKGATRSGGGSGGGAGSSSKQRRRGRSGSDMSDSGKGGTPAKTAAGGGNSNSSGSGKGDRDGEEEEEGIGEAMAVDRATTCLYVGAVVRYILFPVLEDRNGHLNTYLIRSLHAFGAVDAFLDALVFVQAALSDAVADATTDARRLPLPAPLPLPAADAAPAQAPALLSPAGRCALYSLPNMFQVMRKLVQRELYLKSPVTTAMTDLVDDIGAFDMHDLLHEIFTGASKRLVPVLEHRLLTRAPPELQQEWLAILGDLVGSLQLQLPPPAGAAAAAAAAAATAAADASSLAAGWVARRADTTSALRARHGAQAPVDASAAAGSDASSSFASEGGAGGAAADSAASAVSAVVDLSLGGAATATTVATPALAELSESDRGGSEDDDEDEGGEEEDGAGEEGLGQAPADPMDDLVQSYLQVLYPYLP
jgi:hypothetical protein